MQSLETQSNCFVFDTPEQVALAAAEKFAAYAQAAIADHRVFSVALSGGNTPKRVYELLASAPRKDSVEWPRVHLFFGDERAVPPKHPDSNYRMVFEALISRVPISASNVHRVIGEENPEESARLYENELRTFFAGRINSSWPRFDLVFLGMGTDGHTASLFPESETLTEKSKWVVTSTSSSGQQRITMTLPVFNHAAHVVFLVTGKEKAPRLREVLASVGSGQWAVGSRQDLLPAQMVQPVDGKLEWLVDRAAASLL